MYVFIARHSSGSYIDYKVM